MVLTLRSPAFRGSCSFVNSFGNGGIPTRDLNGSCPPCDAVTIKSRTPAPGAVAGINFTIVFNQAPVSVDLVSLTLNGAKVAGGFVWDRSTNTVTFTGSGPTTGTAVATVAVNNDVCSQVLTWSWTVS